MAADDRLYQLALYLTPSIGDFNIRQLISYCGSAQKVFDLPEGKLLKIPGVGKKTTEVIKTKSTFDIAKAELEEIDKHGIDLLFFTDSHYPTKLKHIPDGPAVLYFKGNRASLQSSFNLAIVGSRNASEYGRSVTEELIKNIAGKDIMIVSGLAYGIDIQAHRMALKYGLPTIAVMGNGMDKIYPTAHRDIAKQMQEAGGIMTELPLGSIPDAHNFPARNRIVAGMADAVIVVEAAKKGGALITAELANGYNREVFAVPGNLGNTYSEGCNNLINQNKARIFTSINQCLAEMGWDDTDLSAPKNQNGNYNQADFTEEEWQVLNQLIEAKSAILLDELSWRTQINVSRLAGILLSLEFKGVVKSLPGKRFGLS